MNIQYEGSFTLGYIDWIILHTVTRDTLRGEDTTQRNPWKLIPQNLLIYLPDDDGTARIDRIEFAESYIVPESIKAETSPLRIHVHVYNVSYGKFNTHEARELLAALPSLLVRPNTPNSEIAEALRYMRARDSDNFIPLIFHHPEEQHSDISAVLSVFKEIEENAYCTDTPEEGVRFVKSADCGDIWKVPLFRIFSEVLPFRGIRAAYSGDGSNYTDARYVVYEARTTYTDREVPEDPRTYYRLNDGIIIYDAPHELGTGIWPIDVEAHPSLVRHYLFKVANALLLLMFTQNTYPYAYINPQY